METPDTTAPPFCEWLIAFMLTGPKAGPIPRDAGTRRELQDAWGRFGEKARTTWAVHGERLREIAAARGVTPGFHGAFFFEAVAKGTRR